MTFDPFGDFATRGYLRNIAGAHDPVEAKQLEHASFVKNLSTALAYLKSAKQLTYADVLKVHEILFRDVYPWAGQDRAQTAPDIAVTKGSVMFAHPDDARAAVAYALRLGQDKAAMKARPGDVMAYLAYGHPFLDGNGRTIMTVHAELAQRASISIDWAASDKTAYLTALTAELNNPGKGRLDAYLKPFVRPAVGRPGLAGNVTNTIGLDGLSLATTKAWDGAEASLDKYPRPLVAAHKPKPPASFTSDEHRVRFEQRAARASIPIPAPTERLKLALAAPPDERGQAFEKHPRLKREMEFLASALERKLGPDERAAIAAKNYDDLAAMLKTTPETAKVVAFLDAQITPLAQQLAKSIDTEPPSVNQQPDVVSDHDISH